MKKIFLLILLVIGLVGCGGGGTSSTNNVANSVNTIVWTDEEIDTINYNDNLFGVKYNVTDKYDYRLDLETTDYCDCRVIISKRDTTFTTTLYSQTFLIIKTGDSKYELTTNGTTTKYTSLQTTFNIVNQFN